MFPGKGSLGEGPRSESVKVHADFQSVYTQFSRGEVMIPSEVDCDPEGPRADYW